MTFLGAYILPHGAIALNPSKNPQFKELEEIYKSCYTIANEVYALKPDIIFMTTPHGLSLSRSFGFFCNSKASGTAEWENEWKEYKVDITLAKEETESLLKYLKENKYEVEGIISYSEDESLPLRWGEVIPLWFLQQPYKLNTMIPIIFPKVIIMSIPRKRVTEAEQMVSECFDIGSDICEYLTKSFPNKKIVYIVSGDMAHTHIVNPEKMLSLDKDTTNKYSDEADIFDKAIEKWASDPIANEKSLFECSKIVNKYLSCGYTGFVILQGFISRIKILQNEILGEVLCNLHPSYYGMMVAKFKISKFN
jgi:aromatic ring-opening dioxygenase LigB subunit